MVKLYLNDIDVIVSEKDFDRISGILKAGELPFEVFISSHNIHANHQELIENDKKPFDLSFDSFERHFLKQSISMDNANLMKIGSNEVEIPNRPILSISFLASLLYVY